MNCDKKEAWLTNNRKSDTRTNKRNNIDTKKKKIEPKKSKTENVEETKNEDQTRTRGKRLVNTVEKSEKTDRKPNKKQETEVSKSKKKDKNAAAKEEELYIIEKLLKKQGGKYLVKWETYTAKYNTWEPRSSIPGSILKFYEEDLSRLGKPVPSV